MTSNKKKHVQNVLFFEKKKKENAKNIQRDEEKHA